MTQQYIIDARQVRDANRFKNSKLKDAADRLLRQIDNTRSNTAENRFYKGVEIYSTGFDGCKTNINLVYDFRENRFVVEKYSLEKHLIENESKVLEHLEGVKKVKGTVPKIVGHERYSVYLEAIDGQSLETIKHCNIMTKIRVIRDTPKIVRELHRASVVSRDIKPGNIIVADDRIVLIDFGLSKIDGKDNLQCWVIGTPHYMSPEQTIDSNVGFPSDIYNLGVVFYEMLSGRLPFTHPYINEMMQMRRTQDPPKIEIKESELKPLENVVMKCLERKPEKRFSSEDLSEAIEEQVKIIARKNTHLKIKNSIFEV